MNKRLQVAYTHAHSYTYGLLRQHNFAVFPAKDLATTIFSDFPCIVNNVRQILHGIAKLCYAIFHHNVYIHRKTSTAVCPIQ